MSRTADIALGLVELIETHRDIASIDILSEEENNVIGLELPDGEMFVITVTTP